MSDKRFEELDHPLLGHVIMEYSTPTVHWLAARMSAPTDYGHICLVCGAAEPCMTDDDLQPGDPGTPCTFEPPRSAPPSFQCPRCGVKLPDMDGCEGCDDPFCAGNLSPKISGHEALMDVLKAAEALLDRTDFWHSGDGNGLVYAVTPGEYDNLVDTVNDARTFIHSDLEPGGTRSAIFPVNGYLCRHEKLNGTSGTCPDCGWAVQVFNPYGSISTVPERQWTEHEQAQGKAIADAISGDWR